MPYQRKKSLRGIKTASIDTKIRKKLGLTQAQFAAILDIPRIKLTRYESGSRELDASSGAFLADLLLQFHELEIGNQSTYRTLETKLFLNAEYKKALPQMKALEQQCRLTIKEMKKDLENMKQQAKDREHTIIIFTKYVKKLEEEGKTDKKTSRQIAGFNLFKQKAYDDLLTCWEPEQAKLHARIEALAGEAKALRRYRTKIIKEQNPYKKAKKN